MLPYDPTPRWSGFIRSTAGLSLLTLLFSTTGAVIGFAVGIVKERRSADAATRDKGVVRRRLTLEIMRRLAETDASLRQCRSSDVLASAAGVLQDGRGDALVAEARNKRLSELVVHVSDLTHHLEKRVALDRATLRAARLEQRLAPIQLQQLHPNELKAACDSLDDELLHIAGDVATADSGVMQAVRINYDDRLCRYAKAACAKDEDCMRRLWMGLMRKR
jgi:hypothetical protein